MIDRFAFPDNSRIILALREFAAQHRDVPRRLDANSNLTILNCHHSDGNVEVGQDNGFVFTT